mmetsp:Transcript_9539/g.16395  ORF Transcript_9539/g.16395 Transcript_9539/m.16395 type:complete len:201 (+) Transcript_9539:311-913(+)
MLLPTRPQSLIPEVIRIIVILPEGDEPVRAHEEPVVRDVVELEAGGLDVHPRPDVVIYRRVTGLVVYLQFSFTYNAGHVIEHVPTLRHERAHGVRRGGARGRVRYERERGAVQVERIARDAEPLGGGPLRRRAGGPAGRLVRVRGCWPKEDDTVCECVYECVYERVHDAGADAEHDADDDLLDDLLLLGAGRGHAGWRPG